MKSQNFKLVRYDADDGKVFDWKEPRYNEEVNENGEVIKREQEHLYVKTLFIGGNDSIENYVEIDEAGNVSELTAPVDETETALQILMEGET